MTGTVENLISPCQDVHFEKQLKVKWKNAIQRRGKIVKQQTINIVPRYQDSWNAALRNAHPTSVI